MDQLRGPIDRLSFALYRVAADYLEEAEGQDKNFVLGSFAAASAAGLIYVGSGGKTLDRLHRILHFDRLFEARCTPELITIAFRQAVAYLTKRPDRHFPLKDEQRDSSFQLVLAHRAFFRKGTQITSTFQTASRAFSLDIAEIERLNGSHNLESLRVEINQWVNEHTNGHFTEVLQPLELVSNRDALTHMFLLSVTSMRAQWEQVFKRENVQYATFHNYQGKKQRTKFIVCDGINLPYAVDGEGNYKYLEIPYANNEASLCIVLPNENKGYQPTLVDLVRRFSFQSFKQISLHKRLRKVSLRLPVFKIDNTFNMKDFFTKVGVYNDDDVDYSNMLDGPADGFRLSGAFHKCSFDVDEKGSSARFFENGEYENHAHVFSGTQDSSDDIPITSNMRSRADSDVERFHVDHPFMFFVRHNLSGMILFIGRVIDLAPPADTLNVDEKSRERKGSGIPLFRKGIGQLSRQWQLKQDNWSARKRTGTL